MNGQLSSNSLKDCYRMIIIDECHHVPAVSFESALALFLIRYVLGFTATPFILMILHKNVFPSQHLTLSRR